MSDYLQAILSNESLLVYLGIFSLLSFIVTLIVIPWLILQIPEDYFARSSRHSLLSELSHPVLRPVLLVTKNLVGAVFILLGIPLLVLPGQGFLTMLLGIILIDFPGKYHLERWLVSKQSVLRSVNWLRNKGKRAPIKL